MKSSAASGHRGLGDNPRMQRAQLLEQLAQRKRYDIAIVGGGATGLGVALDAAARGLSVVLIESHDFGGGTSSRATKLVHGGVRYLAQGNFSLVREALRERATLLRNAPHLAQPLPFVMPAYRWWELPFFGAGLKIYDAMAAAAGLGRTEWLGAAATRAALPTLRADGLRGGVLYWDGQFDDARLAIALARTAAREGALVVNHCLVTGLLHEEGKVSGLRCQDRETGRTFEVAAGCVVNATGVWVDTLRQHDGQATGRPVRPLVAPSQGVHLVVDRDFLPGRHALIVPRTADGRVLFAVPWLGKLILGTTDTARPDLPREPQAFPDEVGFILREARRYLVRPPRLQDVRSQWVGLRPLVRPAGDESADSRSISREHTVQVSPSGLVTVTGGKWTTYRAMAQDVLIQCEKIVGISRLKPEVTANLPLVGGGPGRAHPVPLTEPEGLHLYGSEASRVQALPGADRRLGGGLTGAMVRFAARHEYARTVEDVLARRSRLLFLDARLAQTLAAPVAALLRQEIDADPQEAAFLALANRYLPIAQETGLDAPEF